MGSTHPATNIPRGADDMANDERWKKHMYSNGNNKWQQQWLSDPIVSGFS